MQQRYAFLAEQFACFGLPVVILDLESTGGDLMRDHITEIAFLRFDGQSVERYSQLVNPQVDIPEFITELTGISNEMVANAPTFAELLPDILPSLRGSLIVAHNSHFDYTMLRHESARAGVAFATAALCTVKLSHALYPHERKHNLDAIVERFQLIPDGERHRAWSDVAMLADFLQVALREHLDTWQETAWRLLQPKMLPEDTPEWIRESLATFGDGFGVAVLHLDDEVQLRLCEHGYRDMVEMISRQPSWLAQVKRLEFVAAGSSLQSMVEYAKLARQWQVDLGQSGRHTVSFYEQSGCLKAKVHQLANGFYEKPPTGVFLHPKGAKRALQEWASAQNLCPTRLGILPHTLPKDAPCPVSLVKSCVCKQTNLDTHNLRVKWASTKLPTADWLYHPRLRIREKDRVRGEDLEFVVERGALLLDDDTWFVSHHLFDILKHKFKTARRSIVVDEG